MPKRINRAPKCYKEKFRSENNTTHNFEVLTEKRESSYVHVIYQDGVKMHTLRTQKGEMASVKDAIRYYKNKIDWGY